MDNVRSKLEQILHGSLPPLASVQTSELAIYGAGNCGRKVGAIAEAHGLRVLAYLDARAGDELHAVSGVPCFKPDSAEARRLASKDIPIVVGVFNYATDTRPIKSLLSEIGFRSVISYPEFHEQFADVSDFWLTKRAFYRSHASEILSSFDLFADRVSQQVYHDCIAFRLSFNADLLSTPDSEHQYIPADVPLAGSPMRLVDGGAYTGDTLQLLQRSGVDLRAVAAFEPDADNYRQLCATLRQSFAATEELVVVPCGLGKETALRSFHSGAGAASGISDDGSVTIQVAALDDILPAFAPTLIKLDVEGGESDALRGAANVIRAFTPDLAVCVYHAPEHLWTLPAEIKAFDERYRLALRYHQWNGFDTVAYAYTE